MWLLEELHLKIDGSSWDAKDEELFNSLYQELNQLLSEKGEADLQKKSESERQALLFSKDPEKGLSFKMAGTKKFDDGTEVRFEWPDIQEWDREDFTHIRTRFDHCKNLYTLTEYGLLLFYSGSLKNNKDVVRLLDQLIDLGNSYLDKYRINKENRLYVMYFYQVLDNAFHIANNRKTNIEIKERFEKLILLATFVHHEFIQNENPPRFVIDLTEFPTTYKKEFTEVTSLPDFLSYNFKAALALSRIDRWGTILICDISQNLADAISDASFGWQALKAEQFEAMAQDAIEKDNLAGISYVESALAIYKRLKNEKKVSELSTLYQEVRAMFRLGEVRQELPQEEIKRIMSRIQSDVENKTSKELLELLCTSPMFSPIEIVQSMADRNFKESSLSALFPSSIMDKHGNTVEEFIEEEEKKRFAFWQAYDFQFQIGVQALVQLFLEGVKVGKFNYKDTMDFLQSSWMGRSYKETYNGDIHIIYPIDTISEGLNLFFEPFEKWKTESDYRASFICSTDTLVTKCEYLLRFLCKLIGIPTFADKAKQQGHRIKMEKNIDELLRSLKHTVERPTGFVEEHRIFIQFVLANKMGYNLRHKVAHGLMDADEYNFENPLLTLLIILKLSTYTFEKLP